MNLHLNCLQIYNTAKHVDVVPTEEETGYLYTLLVERCVGVYVIDRCVGVYATIQGEQHMVVCVERGGVVPCGFLGEQPVEAVYVMTPDEWAGFYDRR